MGGLYRRRSALGSLGEVRVGADLYRSLRRARAARGLAAAHPRKPFGSEAYGLAEYRPYLFRELKRIPVAPKDFGAIYAE